jgi:ADP-ribose pyrophosphatase
MTEVYYRDQPLIDGFKHLMRGEPHYIARTAINGRLLEMAGVELGIYDLQRFVVPNAATDWSADLKGYNPTFIDLPRGETKYRKKDDVTDPSDASLIETFTSLEAGEIIRGAFGRPLNPTGRTGLTGRGMLNKWGPTIAADAVLSRVNQTNQKLEVLLVDREDTGEPAFPGGKLKDGETGRQAAGRELVEECNVNGIDSSLMLAKLVYKGYVDDSRNTDNAWMESWVYHYHLTDDESAGVTVEAGDDAVKAHWEVLEESLYNSLFASHGRYLREIMAKW